MKTTNHVNVKEMKQRPASANFDQLFKQISPEEICDNFNIFTLVGKDFYVITAGKEEHYNSMTGSGGGMGLLFKKPTTWCTLRADRYTLELIQKEQTYTLSYFPNEYKEQILFLGSKSGRDSEKMKEVALTSVQTPSEDMSFKEAGLIIECRLTQITTPNPNDFYTQEAKDYINKAYKDANDYRKYVFGEITHVWVTSYKLRKNIINL
ncbi:Flavoredoxin [termite gut metagenome]|uniref:Flavoredoxin n=1 Tax=termite gut metagenome TaxID=433724 RepID=A0A5J4QRM4_9ZZZZ